MKKLTVLAAALAAGLTTFAANAQEEGSKQVAMLPAKPEIARADRRTKDDLVVGIEKKDAAQPSRGLTAEEVFHAVKAAEREAANAADKKPEDSYRQIVERYASENGVSIQLAHAVITVESNYKVYSLGKAGEVGLMQIKPATARMMGYAGTTTGLFDPETNIKFGMKYLGKAQKLGDGTTCGTILKYNAGHAAKRMNATSRDYCRKVKRHLATSDTVLLDVKAGPQSERGV